MADAIRAITLWPEWAWAICHLDKRVENRDWHPPRHLIGQRLAIHAGAHVGGRPSRPAREAAHENITRMAGFAGWKSDSLAPESTLLVRGDGRVWMNRGSVPTSAVVAVATLVSVDDEERTPWDVPGCWHWRLDDVVVLDPPAPMRGAQGLWWWSPGLDGRTDVR